MKETKTIKCHPDYDNKIMNLYSKFGWNILSNQRMQEFTGQDDDGTSHFATFNKITVTREDDYGVEDLIKKYIYQEASLLNQKPTRPIGKSATKFFVISIVMFIISFIFIVTGISSISKGVEADKGDLPVLVIMIIACIFSVLLFVIGLKKKTKYAEYNAKAKKEYEQKMVEYENNAKMITKENNYFSKIIAICERYFKSTVNNRDIYDYYEFDSKN